MDSFDRACEHARAFVETALESWHVDSGGVRVVFLAWLSVTFVCVLWKLTAWLSQPWPPRVTTSKPPTRQQLEAERREYAQRIKAEFERECELIDLAGMDKSEATVAKQFARRKYVGRVKTMLDG